MATSKTLKPTNVTIQIPAFTDKPDQRVNTNCIDKEADAINVLDDRTYGAGTYSCVAVMGNFVTGYGCNTFIPFARSDKYTSISFNSASVYGINGDKKADFTVGTKYKMGFVVSTSVDYSGKSVTFNFSAS